MTMLIDALDGLSFIPRALLAGIGIAAMVGPLGSFVVWRRMAYFGDTIAHAALLGVVLGLFFHMPVSMGILCAALLVAALLAYMQHQTRFSTDTLLGILAHGALSLALVSVAFLQDARVDLAAYLFGDILAVSGMDVVYIYAALIVVSLLLCRYWRGMLLITLHEEIARVEGVPTRALNAMLTFMLAFVVAVSIKLVGALLITSMLIIPSATARYFSRSPLQMALLAACMAMLAVAGGLHASLAFDTPAGPSIVLAALFLFIGGFALQRLRGAGD